MRHIHLISSFLLAFALLGCKSSDEPVSNIPVDAVYDFVTLVESSSTGSVMQMRKSGDSPVITYTSTYDLASASTHVSVGDRVIICYRPKDDALVYQSGPITLYAYAKLMNTEQKLINGYASAFDDWLSGPFHISALWRAGEFVNVQAMIYGHQAVNPKKYVMVADAATLGTELPELHLIYIEADDNKGLNPYTSNASFDISEVWSLPTCRGVVIKYPTTSGDDSVTFMKY